MLEHGIHTRKHDTNKHNSNRSNSILRIQNMDRKINKTPEEQHLDDLTQELLKNLCPHAGQCPQSEYGQYCPPKDDCKYYQKYTKQETEK